MNAKKVIFIIEDDIDLIESMTLTLKNSGFHVLSEYTPENGFKKIKHIHPDLIILDVMFGNHGKVKGFDVAVDIRRDRAVSGIPILMITSVNMMHPGFNFSPQCDGEYLPVDEFINKPAQPQELVETVTRLLKSGESKWKNWPDRE